MSLTSYRAAPPRGIGGRRTEARGRKRACPPSSVVRPLVWRGLRLAGLACCLCPGDLAATYSPASWDAVPLALRVFTAEFGMGSGVCPLAMTTRSSGQRTEDGGQISSSVLCSLSSGADEVLSG